MVFGEIVEPSSRALWEDDFVDFPEYEGTSLEWTEVRDIPTNINALIVVESASIIKLIQSCTSIEESNCKWRSKNGSIEIHEVPNGYYIAIYRSQKDAIVGEIVTAILPWIQKAKRIYTLTSASITSLQNCSSVENSVCLIRTLENKQKEKSPYTTLEVPNLVSGFSAGVFSYCIHEGVPCSFFVGYLDTVSLDSVNTQPLVELLRYFGLESVKDYCLKQQITDNNLYM